MHRAHAQEVKHLLQPALQLCRTFKSQLTRGRNCLYCHNRVGAPARHAEQCTVLFQLTIAKLTLQDPSTQHDGGHGQSRGGHLSLLVSERGASPGGDVGQSAAQEAQATPSRVRPTAEGLPIPVPAQLRGAALDNEHLRLVSKILLQHGDSIQQIRQDRAFVMFRKEEQRSLLPAMMAMAREWNLKKDKGIHPWCHR